MTKEEIDFHIAYFSNSKINAVYFHDFINNINDIFIKDIVDYESFCENIGIGFEHLPIYILAKDIKKYFSEIDYGDKETNNHIKNFMEDLNKIDDLLLFEF